jgi:hypothetical protein
LLNHGNPILLDIHVLFTHGSIGRNLIISRVLLSIVFFSSYIPDNDVIFSQSSQAIYFISCQNMYTVEIKHYMCTETCSMLLCVPRSKAYTYQFYLNIILTKQVVATCLLRYISDTINNSLIKYTNI